KCHETGEVPRFRPDSGEWHRDGGTILRRGSAREGNPDLARLPARLVDGRGQRRGLATERLEFGFERGGFGPGLLLLSRPCAPAVVGGAELVVLPQRHGV